MLVAGAGAPRSWLKSVEQDFEWLATRTAAGRAHGHAALVRLAADEPRAFRTVVRKATCEPAANHREQWAPTKAFATVGDPHTCATCSKVFPSKNLLSLHRWHDHGLWRDVRNMVTGTVCEVCLQDFHTRHNLLKHLTNARAPATTTRCAAAYRLLDEAEPTDPAAVAAAEEKGRAATVDLCARGMRKFHAPAPVFRVAGPHRVLAYKVGMSQKSLFMS